MNADLFSSAYAFTDLPVWLLTIILIWTLLWKGLALWKSSKRNSPIWFVALLVINTLGILEILYLFLFSEINFDKKPVKSLTSSKSRKRKLKKKTRKR